jgi:hypothetical protein
MSENMPNSADLNWVLKELELFIGSLKFSNLKAGWTDEPFTLISEGGLTVILSQEDAEKFSEIIEELHRAITQRRAISKEAVSRLTSDCLIAALKPGSEGLGAEAIETVRGDCIMRLKKSLFAPEHHWRLFIPVGGLAPSGLPQEIGKIQFRLGDEKTISDIVEELRSYSTRGLVVDEVIAGRFDKLASEIRQLAGNAVAIVEADAVDYEAAYSLAINRLRTTLDCVNFYADRHHWGMWAYLLGDTQSSPLLFVALPIDKEAPSDLGRVGGRRVGPIRAFPLNQLARLPGFQSMSEMLRDPERWPAERILTPMGWAGRAQVATRPEEAFLLYAISLESLLLGRNRSEELGYRLRTRCAHLIGKAEARKEIVNQVGRLYNIRSDIVHSGSTEVPESDLALIRGYCRSAIGRVLADPLFLKITSEVEFERWFESRVLGVFE